MAGPAILANSSAPLVGLVDTWAIGHLPGAGPLAAVGLGSVIFSYLLWAFGFLRMGTTGLVAQAKGRQDVGEQVAVAVRSAALALGLGATLVALQGVLWEAARGLMAPPAEVATLTWGYYRVRIWAVPFALWNYAALGVLFGLGRTRTILGLQVLLNVTNGALNLLFVVGLGMGVAGVAWGTLIAQVVQALVGTWVLVRVWGWAAVARGVGAASTWVMARFRRLLLLNGFLFARSLLLMTALAMVMREAARLGEVEMGASHVVTQYMLLTSLGLDGFAHAAEALVGAAWGRGGRARVRRWVELTGLWSVVASVGYAGFFWGAGDAVTAALTDVASVRAAVDAVMPLVVALPVVSVASFLFDGVYVGATAAGAMLGTMAVAFAAYLLVVQPLSEAWGLGGLWGAVLVFNGARGVAQAIWYPVLERRLG